MLRELHAFGISVSDEFSPTKRSNSILLLVIFFAMSLNYIFTPLGGDQRVNIAFAQQAHLSGAFPGNLVEAWTIRGIGYKFLTYVFYIISSRFVGYENKEMFEIVFRICMLVLFAGGSFFSAWVGRHRLNSRGFDYRTVGFLTAAGFLTLSHWAAFQAEDTAGLLAIIGVGLGISRIRYSEYLAGVVLALTITMKGITVLLAPVGVLLIVVLDNRITAKHIRITISGLLTGIFIAVTAFAFAPSVITDLLEATKFQSTFSQSLLKRVLVVLSFYNDFGHLPIILPAGILGVAVLIREARQRNHMRLAAVLIITIVPLLNVIIQAKGFPYHFGVLIPTAIAIIMWASLDFDVNWLGPVDISSMIVLAFLILSITTVTPFSIVDSTSPQVWDATSDAEAAMYQSIERDLGIAADDEVLYLSDGTATYHIEARSALRYFYPLPLSRSYPKLRQSELFRQTYSKALDYDGLYIIKTAWFDLQSLPELSQKLNDEYCVVAEREAGTQDVEVYARINGRPENTVDHSMCIRQG